MKPEITVLPGIIYWYDGYQPVELGDPCVHSCAHAFHEVIAWGPTVDKYELIRCQLCECRGWRSPGQKMTFRLVP